MKNFSFILRSVLCAINLGLTVFNIATGAFEIAIFTASFAAFCALTAALAYEPQVNTNGHAARR